MCEQWLRLCFWNVLDWPEVGAMQHALQRGDVTIPQILTYLTTCMVLGAEFQVYYCVAALQHMRKYIVAAVNDSAFIVRTCG